MARPKVFIASSTESLDVAYAAQENLEYDAECTVWTQGVMRLSRATMSNLIEQLNNSDFGIFVLGSDDVLLSRGEERAVARDNVVLELGMFAGRLGVESTFIVKPRGQEMHLPTDLLGLAVSEYTPDRQDRNLSAALGPAMNAIRRELRRFQGQAAAPVVHTAQSFRQVDWGRLLASGTTELSVAVHYFDSWVNANLSGLQRFVNVPGTTVTVVVSDPTVDINFRMLQSLFPESSEPVLLEKITKTGRRFTQAFDEAGADQARLAFYLSPQLLTYSAQCIDRRTLVISIFEMYRRSRIDSPAFEIDLETAPQIRSFWDKEWSGLLTSSRRVDPFDPLSAS